MATSNLQPGAAPANAPSRRGMIAAMAAAPLLSVPALAAPTLASTAFSAAVAKYHAARAAEDQFDQTVMIPAYNAAQAAEAAIPHVEVEWRGSTLSTASIANVQMCKQNTSAAYARYCSEEQLVACRAVADGYAARMAAIAADPIINRAHELGEQADVLMEARCEAEEVAVLTPAAKLSDAIWKIERARERWADFEDWPESWWDAVMIDLKRLAQEA